MSEMNLKQELCELFGEEVYFRDDGRDNAITERFKFKENKNVICFICCEGGTEKHLDYYVNYGGSDELAKIKTKYLLNHDWETNCIAYLYEDKEMYEEDEEINDLSKITDQELIEEFQKRFLCTQFMAKDNLEDVLFDGEEEISQEIFEAFKSWCHKRAFMDEKDYDLLLELWDMFNAENGHLFNEE